MGVVGGEPALTESGSDRVVRVRVRVVLKATGLCTQARKIDSDRASSALRNGPKPQLDGKVSLRDTAALLDGQMLSGNCYHHEAFSL